jgi:exopolysaccharide production protein ExoQ
MRTPDTERIAAVLCVWSFLAFSRPKFLPGSVVLLVAVILLTLLLMTSLRTPKVPSGLILLVGTCAVSASWAEFPMIAVNGAALLAANVIAGAYLADYLDFERFISIANTTMKIVVIVSLGLAAAVPAVGIEHRAATAGSLVGVFPQRNGAAFVITLATAILFYAPARRASSRFFWLGIYGLALIWTGSSTSLGIFGALLVVWLVGRVFRTTRSADRVSLFVLVMPWATVVAFLAYHSRGSIASAFGKDLTFSGRSDIWTAVLVAGHERPITGWGYGSAFDQNGAAGDVIFRATGWVPTGAHNGFLTTYLELGAVGVVVAVAALLQILSRAIRAIPTRGSETAVWFGITILFILVVNDLVETRMFIAIGAFLMSYVGRTLQRAIAEDKADRAATEDPLRRVPRRTRQPVTGNRTRGATASLRTDNRSL